MKCAPIPTLTSNVIRLATGAGLGLSLAASSQAAIIGFNGNQGLAGWSYNQHPADTAPPVQIVNNDTIQFTGGDDNRRSIWNTTPQNITDFEANFTYRMNPVGFGGGFPGITFTLQNSPAGTNAVSPFIEGYGAANISPSASITLEIDTINGVARTGYYTNGNIGSGSVVTNPVNPHGGLPIDVQVRYSGTVLSVTMTDGTNVSARNYVVGSLATLLGGPTAYVGFTGATDRNAEQFLSNFSFVPEPASALLLLLGAAAMRRVAR